MTATHSAPPAQQRHPETLAFPAMVSRYRDQIAMALPAHIDPDRLVRIALTCFRTTPKLATADPPSIFACVIQAAQAGLEPGGLGGEAHLVPRWNDREGRYTCTLQVGFKGYLKLARQSGLITDVAARVVHASDFFELELGTTERLVHRPYLGADRGEPVAVYCVATVGGSTRQIEVMSWAEVLAVRDRHAPRDRGGNIAGPWVEFVEPMAIKTVLRKAAKLWPQSAELQSALHFDGREMGRADADRILTGKVVELDGGALELPASDDSTGLLLQQVADADTTEQLDHISTQIDFRALPAKEARKVRDALNARAVALANER